MIDREIHKLPAKDINAVGRKSAKFEKKRKSCIHL